jgi:signal transduction histidine kinase
LLLMTGSKTPADPALAASREAALCAVTAGVSSAVTRTQVLEAVLDESSRVLRSSAGAAYVVSRRAEGEVLDLVARRGLPDALAHSFDGMPLSSSFPVARSVREGAAVWVPSREKLAQEFPEFDRAVSGGSEGGFVGQALAALPLRVRGEVVGGIGLAFPEVHVFDDGERTFLTTMASRCEAAMERARLYEESEEARAAAEQSRAEAEALLRSHEIVAGILAHDLKNPLSAVLMNGRLLRDAETDRTRAIGRRIVTSGERMARMIDQILEWTRLRAGTGVITLERGRCDLGAIVGAVVAEARARKPDAHIVVEASGDLSGEWDADRLTQVVSNLVGNAVDHAGQPGVFVTADGRGEEVRFGVANEGSIDEQILATIFEPFHGRERGSRHRGRGLGLGLYITRQIVEAHGGRVALDPDAIGRVRFMVTLPRAHGVATAR